MWHFIGIPGAGIKIILIVENCDLFSIKPHGEFEFWGAGSRKHFEESLEINFLNLLCCPRNLSFATSSTKLHFPIITVPIQ